jgi:hypothetical protein
MSNLSENKKFHFLYKTTNLINERYYLGMHSTNKLNDGYLGSGTRFYKELKKYGRENFTIEIIEFFDNRQELSEAEKKLIKEEHILDKNCLNLRNGGTGGFKDYEHGLIFIKSGEKTRFSKSNCPSNSEEHRKKASERMKKRWEDGKMRHIPKLNNWKGKKHKKESIEKISSSKKGKHTGSENSQYGTCWITNGNENKKIKKGEIIPNGWNLGRKV